MILYRAETTMGDPPEGTIEPAGDSSSESSMGSAILLQRLNADRQRLREVAARAFRAQEAERSRIARELQEEFAQRLAGILLRLPLARNATDADAREEHFEELRRQVVELTGALNQFAKGLHPPALAELGPIGAIQAYARILAEGSRMRILFGGDDIRSLLSPERELAVYRIVQEALANTVRHSAASLVRVHTSVEAEGEIVEISVVDDGLGFRPGDAQAQGGCIGILGMQERALYVGGEVKVESEPGKGTRVLLRLPIGGEKPVPGSHPLPVVNAPLRGGK